MEYNRVKKKMKNLYKTAMLLLCSTIFFIGCEKDNDEQPTPTATTWTQKANFVGAERCNAFAFSIANRGYVGGGWGANWNSYSDLYEYNPDNNQWIQKANPPDYYAFVSFAIGDKGYILGSGNKLYCYNPTTNTWSQKASFPGAGTYGVVGFAMNNKGYIGLGEDENVNKIDFWEYNPNTDKWTQKSNFQGSGRTGAIGFSINDKGYIVTGYGSDFNTDLWEYDPSTNQWNAKATFSGSGRDQAVAFSINGKGYVGLGQTYGSQHDDFWEYNPNTNQWTQVESFKGDKRRLSVSFALGNKAYVGLGMSGHDSFTYYNDFWEYTSE